MERINKRKWRRPILLLLAVIVFMIIWCVKAPRKIINNADEVAKITFGYAYGEDTSVTAAGTIVQGEEIRSFSQRSGQFKYVKVKPLIKGKAVSPDGEPIWIAVQYKNGIADRFIVFPNGGFVAMKNNDTKPRVGHIGLFSSQKGVEFYEELVGQYPGK